MLSSGGQRCCAFVVYGNDDVMSRFKAAAEVVIGNLVLARYDDLRVSEDNDAQALREWFPIQTTNPGSPPDAVTGSGYCCHTNPGYHARPVPPAQVQHQFLACPYSVQSAEAIGAASNQSRPP